MWPVVNCVPLADKDLAGDGVGLISAELVKFGTPNFCPAKKSLLSFEVWLLVGAGAAGFCCIFFNISAVDSSSSIEPSS
jgi:hypothetical protein